MFLQTNDRIINLRNVSNINVLEGKKRIVFNLNYSIEIETKQSGEKSKIISDYVYWDAINPENLEENFKYLLGNQYFRDNFLADPTLEKTFINKNEISSVKFSEKKHRVIFNLCNPVTFKDFDGNLRITSEFVYVNCSDFKEYKEYVKKVQICTGLKNKGE